jgi:AAA ATPase domain
MAYRVTIGRFVGRTQELARLGELLRRATAGEPLVALVGGAAGVGKTRLVEQLAATADGQGVRVLGGGCVPLGEEGLPFAPLVEALRGLAGELDPAGLAAELVRRALALVDQAHQPQRAGLLGEQLARCLRMRGDPAALDAQQQAVRLMAPEASVERARVLGSLAQYLLVVADRSEEPGDWRSRRSPSPSRSVPSPRRPPPAPPGRRPHLPRRP